MIVKLDDYQLDSVDRLQNGSILCGGVGSGKSRTALVYYFEKVCGGSVRTDDFKMMEFPRDLYIITTAHKRDTLEWETELPPFLLSTEQDLNLNGNKVIIDSWNNIKKYADVQFSFFIFDEQRLVGSGAWVKAFLKIAKQNQWILLSATPGDTWMDYIPVFIANGFYRNRTEFIKRHVVYKRFAKYPIVERYLDVDRLVNLKETILVRMDYQKPTVSHNDICEVGYDRAAYYYVVKNRWNIYKNKPIENPSEFVFILKQLVFSDFSRLNAVKELVKSHPRSIIFYNYDFELDLLREWIGELNIKIAEHNGHKHEPVPETEEWVYLVQYNSGSEAWNCTTTNFMIFYSLNPSYKMMHQASGRIDRRNTPFKDLYYVKMLSKASIDKKLEKTLAEKRVFNAFEFFEENTFPLIEGEGI